MVLAGRMASSCLQGRKYGRTKAHSLASQNISTSVDKSSKLVRTHLLRGTRFCNSQAYAKDSIGAQFSLVLGSIQLVQELINLCLVRHIKSFLDDRGAEDLIDICDGFENPFSTPFGLVAIPKLTCFVLPCSNVSPLLLCDLFFPVFLPCAGSARHDTSVETGAVDKVYFHGGIATTVVYVACVDSLDCHVDWGKVRLAWEK